MSELERPPGQRLAPLIELVRAHLTEVEPERDTASLAVVRRRLERANRRAIWRVSFAALAAAAAIGLFIFQRRPEALALEVLIGELSSTGHVGPSSEATTIRFSDGTHVKVGADARAQVTAVSANGADVRLDQGHVELRVVKREGASWNVLAGEYRVHVTGTSFGVSFDEALDTLEVEMFSGSVRVSGPLLERGIDVTEGQRLAVDPTLGSVQVKPREPATASLDVLEPAEPDMTVAEVSVPDVSAAPARAASNKRHRPRQPSLRQPSWQAWVAAGQFDDVIEAAERRGLDQVYEAAPLNDLDALADAARYLRQNPIARGALLASRRRFAGSPQAKQAAFLLGRLVEADAELAAPALEWYERYLEEDAGGVYASQALGRKLLIVHRMHGAAKAAPLAEEYLKRFPRGPYAPSARKLVTGQ